MFGDVDVHFTEVTSQLRETTVWSRARWSQRGTRRMMRTLMVETHSHTHTQDAFLNLLPFKLPDKQA